MSKRWQAFRSIASRIVDQARELDAYGKSPLTLVCYSAPSTLAALRGRTPHFGTHQALTQHIGLTLAQEGFAFTVVFNPDTIDEGFIDAADFID